ncbi:enolase C-terminal domain-like protein [Luteimicrobium xylanilyticum]|uniref:L-fuconate dehydratase n=1 Tax=Luteimicrobium xylanilyticum TaxID=1133546 RepID=A0A5P9Q6U9_9MICO|nr:enolase C-terminal domain-like protein [Luteimicrobium xylanilyticum]QFU97137.1 L-fuconate dehydratase [Luteimicrobium xylanilyticum]
MSGVFEPFTVVDVRFPTSRDLDGSDAMNPDPDYSAAYVEVPTSTGESGVGFVFTIGRGNEVAVSAIRAVEDLVVGLDVDATLADLGGLWKRLVHDSQLRWLGPEKGVVHMAVGAVVNAVWDLRAKREGKPLWRLLAELSPEETVALVDFRHLTDVLDEDRALELLRAAEPGKAARIAELEEHGYPAYTTSAGWLGYSDEKVRRLVREALDDGFTHLKLKVGADADDDARRVGMVRELVGPDVRLSIDANQVWEVPEAVSTVARLAPYDLTWVEEPTSPDDILGLRAVAEGVAPVLVATGEHVANRIVFKQLLATGAIGVCQIDACRVAGVNENIAILLLAAQHGVPVCPHAGGVGLCEVVQHLSFFDYAAVSGSQEGRWIEFVDHLHEHFVEPARIERGRYTAPRLPGSGAQLLDASVERYRYPDGPAWTDTVAEPTHTELTPAG